MLNLIKDSKKINFFIKLLTSKSGLSSRRFIALLCVPPLIIGAFRGIFSPVFSFYLTAMLSMWLLVAVCYFLLDWTTVAEFGKSFISKINFKNKDNGDEITKIDIPSDQIQNDN